MVQPVQQCTLHILILLVILDKISQVMTKHVLKSDWPFNLICDETELRAYLCRHYSPFPSFSLPSKNKRHRIKRERAVMAAKIRTELCFILTCPMSSYSYVCLCILKSNTKKEYCPKYKT